ncbi:MAG: O-antigen ligase family protein [Patescibacteria group bacterium]
MLFWILTPAIVAGQLIKLGGVTVLDLAVIFLCLHGLVKLRFKLKKPPLFIISALFFILIALFSLTFTPLRLQPGEYVISFLYTVRFSAYILLGWLIYSGGFQIKQTKKILVYSGVTLAVLGLIQLVFLPDMRFLTAWGWDPHYFRAASTFLDPNFLGAFLVLTLLLVKNFRFLFAAIFITLLLTFSRGAYLAFLVSFLTLSFFQKSVKLGLVTIMLFSGLMLGFFTYQNLVAVPRGINREESASFRFNTWQQGWQIFSQHPILGIGFNSYRFALKQYGLGDEKFLASHGSSTNDSSLLYVAATTGVIGLGAFLFFLFSMIKIGNPILTAGLFGLIAQSIFANNLFYPPILLWMVLISSSPKK